MFMVHGSTFNIEHSVVNVKILGNFSLKPSLCPLVQFGYVIFWAIKLNQKSMVFTKKKICVIKMINIDTLLQTTKV